MASDIVPSSSGWATSQMKPDNSEEASSLWAKNIADNTGYLYNKILIDAYTHLFSDTIFVAQGTQADTTIPTQGGNPRIYCPFYKFPGAGTLFWWAVYGISSQSLTLTGSMTILYNGVATSILPSLSIGTNGTLHFGSKSSSGWSTGWHTAYFQAVALPSAGNYYAIGITGAFAN